jgi:hypothetical protein
VAAVKEALAELHADRRILETAPDCQALCCKSIVLCDSFAADSRVIVYLDRAQGELRGSLKSSCARFDISVSSLLGMSDYQEIKSFVDRLLVKALADLRDLKEPLQTEAG